MGRVQLIVHAPLGGSTGGAILPILWPAIQQGGPGRVAVQRVAERDVRPPHRGGSDGVASSARNDRRWYPSQPVNNRTMEKGWEGERERG